MMGCFGYLTLFLYYVYFLYQMYKVEVEAAGISVKLLNEATGRQKWLTRYIT